MFSALPQDRQIAEIYRDFLPKTVFDAHVHLHGPGTVPSSAPGGVFARPMGTLEGYAEDLSPCFPGVETFHVNCMPMPDKAMNQDRSLREIANEHVSSLVAHSSGNTAAAYVMHGDTPAQIEQALALPGIKAIKCYWFSSGIADGESCTIDTFLPEAAWEAAAQKKLPIFLHMMLPNALADERNFSYIDSMTRQYPEANLVLSHCARAFAAWTGVTGIRKLGARENIWFDMAAVCESTPMMACIQASPQRVLWGTDYPICMHRGRAVSFGTGFQWIIGGAVPPKSQPCTIAAESLLAFYQAALLLNLDQTQIDRIFCHNAADLLGFT